MKQRKVHYSAILLAAIIFLARPSIAQNLEVTGQAKIKVMNTDNTAEQLVVKQTDGTLAVRGITSLPAQNNNTGNYGTVVNPVTGKVWLDRNLGATQVATSSTDASSYGDLYQWGRAADGHQLRTSATQNTQATTWLADEGSNLWDTKFIIGFSDWLTPATTGLWSGTSAENNPCPSGFRIPTHAEWNQERRTWTSNNAAGAFGSPLKLPLAGYRYYTDGSLVSVGSTWYYWSSTVSGANSGFIYLNSGGGNAGMYFNSRANGFSVRCIKD